MGTLAITGVDGFVGRHLVALASARGWHVVGVARRPEPHPKIAPLLTGYYAADLRREWPVVQQVDAVVHLAGLAAVGPSFSSPQHYLEANSAMVTTLCEGLLAQRRRTRVVGISTGAVYRATESEPVSELAPVAETSPYVVSKLLVEHQLAYYARRGLDTVVVRPFNHIGPGQSAGFLLPDLTFAIAGLNAGASLRVGDLTTERDYTDVRDVAAAYLLLVEAEVHEEFVYNVASGQSLPGTRIAALVAATLGRPTPEVEIDPARVRATDPRRIVGSAERLRKEFGWQPAISVEESITDFVASVTPGVGL